VKNNPRRLRLADQGRRVRRLLSRRGRTGVPWQAAGDQRELPSVNSYSMIGIIGEPQQERRLVKNFVAALFECLLEAWNSSPSRVPSFFSLEPLWSSGT
jgi:hypothetical protein